jgi:hypothetical protein
MRLRHDGYRPEAIGLLFAALAWLAPAPGPVFLSLAVVLGCVFVACSVWFMLAIGGMGRASWNILGCGEAGIDRIHRHGNWLRSAGLSLAISASAALVLVDNHALGVFVAAVLGYGLGQAHRLAVTVTKCAAFDMAVKMNGGMP